jgi:hypothetical protein
MANLSVKTGDVDSAAQLLGKAINGNVKVLKQYGISLDESLSREERIAKITETVSQKFGGLAESANKGLGSFKGLETAFGNFMEAIGERLAPFVTQAVLSLTNFFNTLNENKPLLDFVFEVGKIAAIATGMVTALATAGLAIVNISKAFAIAEAAVTSFGLASKVAVGATGIGLLVLIGVEIYNNWSKIFPVIQAVYQTFAENISTISGGLGTVLKGIGSFDLAKIQTGINQVGSILATGFKKIKDSAPKEGELSSAVTASPEQIAAAKKANEELVQNEMLKNQRIKAETEAMRLTLQQASQATIDLKKQEIETLKLLEGEQSAAQQAALQDHLNTIRSMQETQAAIERDQRQIAFDELLSSNSNYQNLSNQQQQIFLQTRLSQLQATIQSERTIERKMAEDRLREQIDSNNRFLENEERFNVVYAGLVEAQQSRVVQGYKSGFTELGQLMNSKQRALFEIGKAAAIANVVIKTAESAMAIYAGFSAIPIVGPVLGLAGAAAAVAFGAEQIANISSAEPKPVAMAEGGRVTGGIPGIDSVPLMAQQNELVVPRQNFNETVEAVALQRGYRPPSSSSGSTAFSGEASAKIEISLTDNLMDFIEAKLVERQRLNISIQGAPV